MIQKALDWLGLGADMPPELEDIKAPEGIPPWLLKELMAILKLPGGAGIHVIPKAYMESHELMKQAVYDLALRVMEYRDRHR